LFCSVLARLTFLVAGCTPTLKTYRTLPSMGGRSTTILGGFSLRSLAQPLSPTMWSKLNRKWRQNLLHLNLWSSFLLLHILSRGPVGVSDMFCCPSYLAPLVCDADYIFIREQNTTEPAGAAVKDENNESEYENDVCIVPILSVMVRFPGCRTKHRINKPRTPSLPPLCCC
jgi:hypothetical protein